MNTEIREDGDILKLLRSFIHSKHWGKRLKQWRLSETLIFAPKTRLSWLKCNNLGTDDLHSSIYLISIYYIFVSIAIEIFTNISGNIFSVRHVKKVLEIIRNFLHLLFFCRYIVLHSFQCVELALRWNLYKVTYYKVIYFTENISKIKCL